MTTAQPEADPLDSMCESCGRDFGDHTMRDLKVCGNDGRTIDWMPLDHPRHREVPLDELADNVDIESAWTDTPIGRMPVLTLSFSNSYRGSLGKRTVIMPTTHMKDLARLVSTSIDQACTAARRGRG